LEAIENNDKVQLLEPDAIITTALEKLNVSVKKHAFFKINTSLNHVLHICSTYNKLRLYEKSISILKKVKSINDDNPQARLQTGVSASSKHNSFSLAQTGIKLPVCQAEIFI
jgi:hypothetical protein